MARASCKFSSFVPGALVQLADGTTKPIEDIVIGDVVLATDPKTGTTAPKEVTATITSAGEKILIDITVDTNGSVGNASATITATDAHPFWAPATGTWVVAGDLQPGQWLQTSTGSSVQVTALQVGARIGIVHNLTIAEIHTYYVVAGDTPVLVHNCGPMNLNFNQIRLRIRNHVMVNHGNTIVPGTNFAGHLTENDIFTGLLNRIDNSNATGRVDASGNHEHILEWPGAGANGENRVRVWMTPNGELGSMWPIN